MPKVSVVIAIHNGAKTLEKSLDSIAAQTFRDFEIICVNDASTDETKEKLHEWQKKHLDISITILTNEKNLGLAASLNRGIDVAKGEFIARLDADDWWTPDKLEKQINWLMQHPEHGLLGAAWMNHQEKQTKTWQPPQTDATIRRRIWWRNPFGHSCVIIRRNLVEKVGGYDESIRYGQDLDLWFRLLPLTKMANLPDVLCHRAITKSEEKQRAQMRQTLRTLKKYSRKYKPPWQAYGGFVEPWLLLHAEWLVPVSILACFLALQLSVINYGTTLNDQPFVRNTRISRDALIASQQQLGRDAIVNPDSAIAPEQIEQGLLRFKLYSVEADEMTNLMALSRINPATLAFDPHYYMYGGSYVYPLGAWYAAAIKLNLLPAISLEQLLDQPDVVDRLYITGRLFVLLSVTLSGVILYRTARLLGARTPATLILFIYLSAPMTLTHSIIMKPHWYSLLFVAIALYYLVRLWTQKRWSHSSEIACGLCLGLAVGAATTYAPFAIGWWLWLAYAVRRHRVPARALVTIPLIAVAVFCLTNPFIFLNFSAWAKEASVIDSWYQLYLAPRDLFYFVRNSLVPGFGVVSLLLLVAAAKDTIHSRDHALRFLATSSLVAVIFAATLTSAVSFWHTSTRFIPYLLPILLLYAARRLSPRALAVLALIAFLQAIPHYVALRDENNPERSTRLQSAAWIEKHISPELSLCAHLVPYNTAPFDFTRYHIQPENCHYIIRVERERPIPTLSDTRLAARFEPRFNHLPLPLVTNHVNPQISIYENLAAH